MSKHNDYWQYRLNDKIYNKTTKELEKQLLKLYKQANKTIKSELAELYVKMLADGEISTYSLFKQNRYNQLINIIDKEISKIGKAEVNAMQLSLTDCYKDIYIKTNEGLGIKTSWSILNENTAKEIVNANFKGAVYSDRIWDNKTKLKQQLEKSIVDTVIAGESKDKAVKIIAERFGVAFSDSDRLVRTETMRVLNSSQKQSYIDNNYTHYEFLAEIDDRTSDICEGLNGKIFAFADAVEGENFPPLHPNCRSTIIPVIE